MPTDLAAIERLTRELLAALGEDPQREGLVKTPERVAKALSFLTSGNRTDISAIINGAIFTQTTNSMVIVKNIEVYSLCEHHMLPFFGRCHIGYIPTGQVFGVSKLARLVDMYARRLQLQERLTEQISHAVQSSIDARGVGVMIEARHLCMMMRGVEKQNSEMVTSSVLGTFRESQATREEFLALIGQRGWPPMPSAPSRPGSLSSPPWRRATRPASGPCCRPGSCRSVPFSFSAAPADPPGGP